ncbi:MAG TPA: hypothetical protein VMM77_06600 [Gemmatimonadaceae bacterium]|nr:hypothetical protein [Gemmatimonadaceae bacterium]
MLEGIIMAVVLSGFFILRGIAATVFFYYMLPDTDQCPCCDSHTLRVHSPGWNRLLPWFRTSWCYDCGWEGLLRPVARDADPAYDRGTAVAPHGLGSRQ